MVPVFVAMPVGMLMPLASAKDACNRLVSLLAAGASFLRNLFRKFGVELDIAMYIIMCSS